MPVGRIDYPDTVDCPDCGREIEGEEDRLGVVYRCEYHDCGAYFDGDELFPQDDDWTPPPPAFVVTPKLNDPR